MRQDERLEARALVSRRSGEFALEDVHTAPLTESTIAVRTSWSGVSIGTELAVLSGRLDWGPFPMTTGYMSAGTVAHVGSAVSGFSVGDRVYCRQNAELVSVDTGETINPAKGLHCSMAVLDPSGTHGADLTPDGVSDEVASMFVVPAVGLYGVDMAGVGVGQTVVVIGVGMVGLGVVGACASRGARVIAVDVRSSPLEVARQLGAATTLDATQCDVDEEIAGLTDGHGADFVFEASGHATAVDLGIRLCRTFGCFIWQGNYGEGQVAFDFLAAHARKIRMVFPCDDGYRPVRRAVLASIAAGRLPWDRTITHRIPADSAPEFFGQIHREGVGDVLGATIRWQD